MEKDDLLSLLIENKEEKYTIRKLALLRNINYKSAYLALQGLEREKLAVLEKVGNCTLCRFTGNFSPRVYAVEHSRREKMLRNKNFLILYNRLKKITLPFIVILFGSWAKKTARKGSDIDLLIISEHSEVEQALRLVPLPVHVTKITYKEFLTMVRSREFTVVSEALKKNIILVGIEEYYRLVQNAG